MGGKWMEMEMEMATKKDIWWTYGMGIVANSIQKLMPGLQSRGIRQYFCEIKWDGDGDGNDESDGWWYTQSRWVQLPSVWYGLDEVNCFSQVFQFCIHQCNVELNEKKPRSAITITIAITYKKKTCLKIMRYRWEMGRMKIIEIANGDGNRDGDGNTRHNGASRLVLWQR